MFPKQLCEGRDGDIELVQAVQSRELWYVFGFEWGGFEECA
jgi:hypothetical protein